MINVLEFVYGSGPKPNPNPIHIFESDKDLYEHAEFYKDGGDFYQIVKVHDNLVLYHFQKEEANIFQTRIEGDWWLKHDLFQRKYIDRPNIFYEKINDRIAHEYRVKKLVAQNIVLSIDYSHPDNQTIREVFK